MPDVSIINVNNTDYSIKDATARTAAQSAEATASAAKTTAESAQSAAQAAQSTAQTAQSTAQAAQSFAESIDITITYTSDTETMTFTKGAE